MSVIVEMYRDATEPRGRDRFSCTLASWDRLQEIAQSFGWQPKGAIYLAPVQLKLESPARRNYHPGGTLDQKRVEHDDAIAWANALSEAKGSPPLAANEPPMEELGPGVIEEFIEFAYGGAFTFVISI